MGPSDIYQVAEHLEQAAATEPSPEGFHRSAISRAYYAAFHACLAAAVSMGFSPSNDGRDHREVRRYLQRNGDAGLKIMAGHLSTLHSQRKMADYHLDDSTAESAAESRKAMVASHNILHALKKQGRI